jgi:hypothetical protein
VDSLVTDFWWLSNNASIDELLVGVGNHRNAADDTDIPPLSSWYRSVNQDSLSNNVEYYPIAFINKWRILCKNTNIYRSLKIFDCNTQQAIFLGPFLVDIDNESDLDASQNVAKQVLEYLTKKLKLPLNDLRIFFTGHKGFNIEIRPEALKICGSATNQIKLSSKKLDEVINYLRENNKVQDSTKNIVDCQGTVIDRIYGDRFDYKLKHPYIRLHDSINRWVGCNGKVISRKKIEVTYQDLFDKSAIEISQESEAQAQNS